jgi:hypothetical protein
MPYCFFLAEDYDAVMKETGLQKEQIENWGQHVRSRYLDIKERELYLTKEDSPGRVSETY